MCTYAGELMVAVRTGVYAVLFTLGSATDDCYWLVA